VSLIDHERTRRSARQVLIESGGTPFAPTDTVRPVVERIDGRRTNDNVEPGEWLNAIKATDGMVAVYFGLAADHEMWIAYDGENWHRWTTYPRGAWDHHELSRGVLEFNIEENRIRRSKVERVDEACDFIWSKIEEPAGTE